MKTTLLLFLATFLLTASCRTDQQEASYEIVMDSIVVTKFSMTDINGNPWDSGLGNNPDLQIELTSNQGSFVRIMTNPLIDVDNTQNRSFGLLNWQLGSKKASEHSYRLDLFDNDNGSNTPMNLKSDIELAKDASPLDIISTDGRFEATLHYHH
jgi:hypothetical protein